MRKRVEAKNNAPAPAKTTWPKPPLRICRDGDGHKAAYKLWEYAGGLEENCSQNAEIRIYRTWPVTDVRLVGKANKDEMILRGPLTFPWEQWREELFHQVGSGGYHVYLNEVGVPGSIMESYFTLQDWEHYPPKVDLRTIIKGEKGNDDYIRWLEKRRVPGERFPWEDPEEDDTAEEEERERVEDEDVAIAEVVERMADKLVQSADKRAEDAKAVQPAREDVATNESIKLVTSAANTALETMAKYVGPQQDPYAGLEKVVGLLNAGKTGNEDNIALTRMLIESNTAANDKLLMAQERQIDFMKSVLVAEKKDVAPVAPPKDLLSQVREVNELKELLSGGRRERNPEPKEGGGFWEGIGKAIAENPQVLGTAATAVVGIVGAISSAWKGAPAQTVASPTEAIARATGTVVQGQSAPAAPAQPTAEELEMARRVEFCKRVGRALMLHLSDKRGLGLNGASFAWWMITEGMPDDTETANGVAFYRHVRAMGYMPFCAMLSPMAEQIQPFGERFPDFWKEFEQYEQSKKEEENATDEQ